MTALRTCLSAALLAALSLAALHLPPASAQGKKKRAPQPEYTSPDDTKLPADYKLQGEYVNEAEKVGCQVIALGKGRFQAVVLPGGLPGAGWDGKHKDLFDGKLDGDKVAFEPMKGKRKYKAQNPDEFTATSKFHGHGDYTSCALEGGVLSLGKDDKKVGLKKADRKSPTMGAKAPEGALVLFDGSGTDEWKGGRLDAMTKWLNTDRNDIRTKRDFANYTVHAEFLLPFLPEARDQGRGNSGFYQADLYEVQILDSFGLDGKHNECGGIYNTRDSKVNACLPPLVWQTYDIDFTSAVRDGDGKKVKNARVTVKLNGITVQDDVEIPKPTGGGREDKYEGTAGPLKFQGHGNILQFRNVWVVEKK